MVSNATSTIGRYYQLSKPGIIRGNLLTAVAGFLLGSGRHITVSTLLWLLVGLTLVIAGACAANNVLDRGIDTRMARTKSRALVTGLVTVRQAVAYSASTTLLGLIIVILSQNPLTSLLIAGAWLAYVVLYGWAKRVTVHSTLVGCISGSLPLVAGYVAATSRLDIVAVQLFVLMTCWQMAHFYGIALYRLDDYRATGVPLMPIVHGIRSTEWQALAYIVLYILSVLWMLVTGSLHVVTAALLSLVGIIWLLRAWRQLPLKSTIWGKRTFLFSLIVVMVMTISFVANPWLGQ